MSFCPRVGSVAEFCAKQPREVGDGGGRGRVKLQRRTATADLSSEGGIEEEPHLDIGRGDS